MKKLLSLLAVCGILFAVTGCDSTSTVTTEKEYPAVVEKPATVTEKTEVTVDEHK